MTKHDLVVCESADGYSLHEPGSTDEQIACGDAPPLVSGEWTDDDHVIPDKDYEDALALIETERWIKEQTAEALRINTAIVERNESLRRGK